ncbi:unnamed protein product [Paramecium octaurelia]|uniref:Dynein light chain n=1 Tax=Paramecium octaurelia TaxID=43137 RepID=A0A8S1STV6_PAROT|nr:unnamed protein product [Paramecium octaurelia]
MTDTAQQINVKLCDMSSELLKDAQYIILENLRKHSNERDVAYYIKRELDKRHTGPWHCVVGKNFGIFVTHEEGYYLQAIKGQITIVVWK